MAPLVTLIILANAARLHTAPALQEDIVLDVLAQSRAEYLCDHPFSHAKWQLWFIATDYSYIGENLAKGYKTSAAAHKALMASPTHRANILNKDYEYIGTGTACGIAVELFGGR